MEKQKKNVKIKTGIMAALIVGGCGIVAAISAAIILLTVLPG